MYHIDANTLRMYNYTSGWVDMNWKLGQREGRWEVRAKLPDPRCDAVWPAIWLMNCGSSKQSFSSELMRAADAAGASPGEGAACSGQEICWPTAGEIDIMEMVGQHHNPKPLTQTLNLQHKP